MYPKVVLYNPQIPQNTGNIARLTAANFAELHLIEPLGFELSDRYLKRAGLDYWPEVSLHIHCSWSSFLTATKPELQQLWFLSTKASKSVYEAQFMPGDFLVFGSETSGLPAHIHSEYADARLCIPTPNKAVRSLNLASSAAIVFYEAIRQIKLRLVE